jgi:PAS domain S-box-containing protein
MRDQAGVATQFGPEQARSAAKEPSRAASAPVASAAPVLAPHPEHYLKTELYQLIRQDPSIFEFLQSGSLDGIWYWDLEHIEHEWLSPRFKQIFGFEDHEVPNTSAWWQERIFPEDLPIALENFARHCEDPDHPYDHVVRYRHRDGSTVWVRCRGMAIRDDGRAVRLLGAHTDVTAFKLAEEQLVAAERKYRDLYDNSPDMYMSVDAASLDVTECNQTLAYFTGFAKNEVVGRRVADFFTEDSGATVSELMASLHDHGRNQIAELSMLRKRGGTIPVQLTTNAVRDAHGKVTEYRLSCRDIQQLKRMEKLNLFLDAAPIAVVMMDHLGQIVLANAQIERLFGFREEELLGQSLETLIPAGLPAPDADDGARFLHPSHAATRELYGRRKDASQFPIEIGLNPVQTPEGVRTIASILDITQRRKAESDLMHRTEELARSNRDLEQFAYVASHDLHEPLRAVAGSVELLQRRYAGKLDAKADEFITHAVDGAARMQRLIDDLLAFSRVGSRGGEFRRVGSQSSLEDALKNLRRAIQESKAEITADFLPELVADPAQLTMLFQNLIGNAIKFHGEQAPRIHVGARCENSECVLSVCDQGIGIDPKYFDRIFNIFQRLHTRREYAGTGVGLAICKRIMERHQGRIWVESTPGVGTTFFCSFPVETQLKPKAKRKCAAGPAPNGPATE